MCHPDEDESPCWFCEQNFHVDRDDNRMVEVFFEDGIVIKKMEVTVCTPCASRLLASTSHSQAKKGPSIIFKIDGIR